MKSQRMIRFFLSAFVVVSFLSRGIVTEAQAQTASAEAHVAKAKAAAYRPGNDISDTFDSMCYPLKSGATQISGAPSPGPTAPRSKEPSAWWAPPAKVFDN